MTFNDLIARVLDGEPIPSVVEAAEKFDSTAWAKSRDDKKTWLDSSGKKKPCGGKMRGTGKYVRCGRCGRTDYEQNSDDSCRKQVPDNAKLVDGAWTKPKGESVSEAAKLKLTKEQRIALKAYEFALAQEDRYLGSVFVTPQGQRDKEAATRAAYERCKALGMTHEHGL
jgi:hypothetical protein